MLSRCRHLLGDTRKRILLVLERKARNRVRENLGELEVEERKLDDTEE